MGEKRVIIKERRGAAWIEHKEKEDEKDNSVVQPAGIAGGGCIRAG
jgi:hypothetical protein